MEIKEEKIKEEREIIKMEKRDLEEKEKVNIKKLKRYEGG